MLDCFYWFCPTTARHMPSNTIPEVLYLYMLLLLERSSIFTIYNSKIAGVISET